MISSILTPVRFYEDYFESDRFASDCDICQFELISDKTRLLPFQFRRNKSPYQISRWFLRKECQDPMQPLIDTNNSLFTLDSGFWTMTDFYFNNSKLKSTKTVLTSTIFNSTILDTGNTYSVKIVVNEIKKTGTFSLTVKTGATTLATITQVGTYDIKFTSGASTDITIISNFNTIGDYVIIQEIQVYKYQKFLAFIGDISLPNELLTLKNINLQQDIIQYCGAELPFQIPCGRYYIIIESNTIFYSELITIKDFIPSQSPYTMIEWSNKCDLSDIVYQPVNGCSYTNRLYIEGELAKPEYPFKEESQEDGNYNINVIFQKWEKQSSLMFPKCPEFIVDALTGIRLHDSVTITKSIREKQFKVLAPIEIEKVEFEIASVFSDCATNVNLKLLLKDQVVDSTCCTNTEFLPCIECTTSVTGLDVEVVTPGQFYFGTKYGVFGLYIKTIGGYSLADPKLNYVCVTGSLPYYNFGLFWVKVPSYFGPPNEDASNYYFTGLALPNTFAQLFATKKNGVGAIIKIYPLPIYTSEELALGVVISKTLVELTLPFTGSIEFYINSFGLDCDYGISDDAVFTYGI